jgi:hypothetical protein
MERQQFTVVSVERHIKLRYNGNKARFARRMGVFPQTVTKWVNKEFVIDQNENVYSKRKGAEQ